MMAIVAALAVAAISVSPVGGMLAQRFDAAFVYISKVRTRQSEHLMQRACCASSAQPCVGYVTTLARRISGQRMRDEPACHGQECNHAAWMI